MLSFEKTPDYYRITETIMGTRNTKITYIDYKFDLSEKRCNNDPWRPTTESDRKWFNLFYTSVITGQNLINVIN